MTAEALQLPQLGEVIGEGRFELLRQLGDGGMSTVFVAVDRFLGRDVALKLLTPRYVGRPEREQRLVKEAEYLRRVQGHPNIVQLIDSGRLRDRDDWPWLATEILRGEELALLFIHGKIEIPRVVAIARQVAVALDACHAVGIVHRDITPNNVFVLEDRQTAKLFDFSHAADLQAPKVAAGAPERLTGVFDTPGTIGYMGPEQVHNAPPDVSMDAFSFGVLLFKLVTGRSPYRQFTDRDEFIRAQRDGSLEPPRLHAWAYDAPEALAELLHDCTQRDGDKRPSMAEVVSRLDAVELPPVQDDDATSFYRPVAAPVSRESSNQGIIDDVTVGVDVVTTAFEPSRAPLDAGQDQPEVTERVDPPTLLRRRHRRTLPPDVIGDWVVANQPAAGVAVAAATEVLHEPEEQTAVQLPFARPPQLPAEPATVLRQEPEPQLAFARPPDQRPPSPIEVVPMRPPIQLTHPIDVPEPGPTEEDDPAPRGFTRGRVLVVGLLVTGVLLVVGWIALDALTSEPAERDRATPADERGETTTSPPSEPKVSPSNETGPALEPVPEVEPIEATVPELQPEPKSKPTPKHKHNPTAPEPAGKDECDGVEQSARAAEDKADWSRVASLTARKECWSSPKERVSLRIRAMFELGNWKECAALGDNAEASVRKYVEHCQSLTK